MHTYKEIVHFNDDNIICSKIMSIIESVDSVYTCRDGTISKIHPYIFTILSSPSATELRNISSQFTLGFGSFVDKIAYPFASTLQNGLDYRERNLVLG